MEGYEKTSGVSKIVGGTQEEKDKTAKHFEDLPKEKESAFADVKDILFEREKTSEEVEIIESINAKLPEFIRSYGGEPAPLNLDQFHILDLKQSPISVRLLFKFGIVRFAGGYLPETQAITLAPESFRNSKLAFAHGATHESIHMHSFTSFELKEKSPGQPKDNPVRRRIGFTVNEDQEEKLLFNDINEAITEELTRRFDEQYFSDMPILKDDIELRDTVRKKKPSKTEGEDIIAVSKVNLPSDWLCILEVTLFHEIYSKKVTDFKMLLKDLYEKNKDSFESEEGVFRLFAKSMLKGNMLDVARLYEKTYGKGSFRSLGERTAKITK